jgi:hypothetical protein
MRLVTAERATVMVPVAPLLERKALTIVRPNGATAGAATFCLARWWLKPTRFCSLGHTCNQSRRLHT